MSLFAMIAFPLAASVFLRIAGRQIGSWCSWIATFSVAASTLIGFQLFFGLTEPISQHLLSWKVGQHELAFGLYFDSLSAIMSVLITVVGLMVHLFSIRYIKQSDHPRYFSYLTLFVAMMLLLVLSDQLLLLFVGWEGVGLCSYLLIGFYHQDHKNTNAAKKAFIMNRIGDAGFLLAMVILFSMLLVHIDIATLGIKDIQDQMGLFQTLTLFHYPLLTLVGFLLLMAVVGKSAQVPLYMWLPDAMAGPTPVSAFIHAASMVTAGIYLMARLYFVFNASSIVLQTILWIGIVTALLGTLAAIFQRDLKKILAFSTISQLGYMVMACGVGVYGAAIFHVVTHGFFKALLFLCAGVIIHQMKGEQDIMKMGGLKKTFPRTYWLFWVGTLALAGIFPTAGFFSKDLILLHVFENNPLVFGLMLVGIFCTGFYSIRLLNLVFEGPSHTEQDLEKHQLPGIQKWPMVFLGIMTLTLGFLWMPDALHLLQPFQLMISHSLPQTVSKSSVVLEWMVSIVSMGFAISGMVWARFLYKNGHNADLAFEKRFPDMYQLLSHQFYLDELYQRAFVYREKGEDTRTVAMTSSILHALAVFKTMVDRYVIDALVHWFAWFPQALGSIFTRIQNGQIQSYIRWITMGALVFLFYWYLWIAGLN